MVSLAILFGVLGLSLLLSLISIVLGLVALLKVMAMEKSTHSVQFMAPEMQPSEDNIEEEAWAMNDKEVNKINIAEKESLDEEIFI